MTKYYLIALMLGAASVTHAQIVEKPLKLDEQNAPDNHNKDGAIQFPPATEPYQPVDRVSVPTPAPVQPVAVAQPVQPAYTTNSNSLSSREVIERTAESCEAELTQLYQFKSNNPTFQQELGKAKRYCDQLKESSKAIRQADSHLWNYQQSLRQAQEAVR